MLPTPFGGVSEHFVKRKRDAANTGREGHFLVLAANIDQGVAISRAGQICWASARFARPPLGREHLLDALQNPAPTHKVRSEFLATMCFAHLMSPEQIETVLESRVEDIERYLSMFDEFECCQMKDWPDGMRFVCGFGKAMTQAMQKYIEENRDMLTDKSASRRSATG